MRVQPLDGSLRLLDADINTDRSVVQFRVLVRVSKVSKCYGKLRLGQSCLDFLFETC